jgi:Fe-S-cluster containining protein
MLSGNGVKACNGEKSSVMPAEFLSHDKKQWQLWVQEKRILQSGSIRLPIDIFAWIGVLMTAETHLCARCAAKGQTCCQGKDRDIYITPGDLKRISEYVARQDFCEFRKPTDPAYLEVDNDPLWMACVFRSDRSRRVLRRYGALGNCIFLTVNGCCLPVQIRPLVCRIFPYAYNAGGFSADFEEGCPIGFLSTGQSLAQCLGMDAQDLGEWHRTLYSEILLEKNDENRTNLRPAV